MKTHRRQHGAVLIIFVIGLVLVALSVLLYQLNAGTLKLDRNQKTALALAEAKAALIGEAISSAQLINLAPARLLGSLLNPNLNSVFSLEGSETGTAGSIDRIVVGKFPWYSLNVSIIKDGGDECLWYAVSGRYKHQPATGTLNWDTQGQIDVIDGNGNQIASNLVALIVSSGSSVSGQNRAVVANTYCGGNYDVKNYLDTPNGSNAVAGEVNYFTGSPNNREASNTNNKKFVMTNNDYYNDQFVFITTDDIFNPIIKRQDFANQISLLLDDPDVQAMAQTQPISGTKGTGNLVCTLILNPANKEFCSHWHEMLLLATTASNPTVIDGVSTSCSRVIIFGGKTVDGIQSRLTTTEKNNPDNYLEGVNRQAFGDPVNFGFNGVTNFNSNNPSADVMRCL